MSDEAHAEDPPEYWVIHMPWPWPHGGAARTLIVPAGVAPPGTGWRVLFRGSGYACTVFLEQTAIGKDGG